MVDSGMRGGLFGAIVIDRRGRVLRGFLTHENWGVECHYQGAAAVRTVIASWPTIPRPARAA